MICSRSRRLRTLIMLKKLLNSPQDRRITVLSFTPRTGYYSFDHSLLELISLDRIAEHTRIERIDDPTELQEEYDTDLLVLDTPSNIDAFRKTDSARGRHMRERLAGLLDRHDHLVLDREQLPRQLTGQTENVSEASLTDGRLEFAQLRGRPPLATDGDQASISEFIRA